MWQARRGPAELLAQGRVLTTSWALGGGMNPATFGGHHLRSGTRAAVTRSANPGCLPDWEERAKVMAAAGAGGAFGVHAVGEFQGSTEQSTDALNSCTIPKPAIPSAKN